MLFPFAGRAQYCTPSSSCDAFNYLDSFTFNGISLSQNSGCSAGGYSSFSVVSTTVTTGVTIPFSGTVGSFYESVSIWADLNHNGSFSDASEQLYSNPATFANTFQGALIIPAGTTTGTLNLRVRIVSTYTGVADDPCSSLANSETEDYQVMVAAPTTYNPYAANITNSSAVLTWNNLGGATSYELQWRPVGGTYTTITGISSTTYALGGLTTGTSYEWQMRPTGSNLWNGPVQFSTLYPCPGPPVNLYTSTRTAQAYLSWSFSDSNYPDATYEIQLRQSGTTSYSTVASAISTTGYLLTGLTPGTEYSWRVRASCSDYSTPASFTTLDCSVPTSIMTNNVVATSAQVYWYDNDYGNTYTVQYKPTTASDWISITGLTSPGYSLTRLTTGVSYDWRVQKTCTATVSSPFSAIANFTTKCNTPYPISYWVKYNRAEIYISSPEPDASYTVQYKAGIDGAFQTISGVSAYPYSLTGLLPNTTYYVQVRTDCSNGTFSDYSPLISFTTQCWTPGISIGQVGWNSVSLSFFDNNAAGETNYVIQYTPLNGTPVSTTASTSPYSLTGLAIDQAYSVQVQAVCAPGITSALSNVASFTTACRDIYGTPSVTNVRSQGATLNWYDSDNTATYEIQYRTLAPTISNFVSLTNVTGGSPDYKSYSLSGLADNTTYEAKIRRVCGTTTSAFTTSTNFTTQCKIPGIPYAQWRDYTTVTLGGFAYEIGASYELQYRLQGTSDWISVTGIIDSSSSYSVELSNLISSSTYETRIRTICSPTSMSPFSSLGSFSTKNCDVPSSLQVSKLGLTSAEVSWSTPGLLDATYELSYAPVSQTATGNWTTVKGLKGTYSSFSVTYSLTGLTPNTDYSWRVRTFCTATASSDYVTGPDFRPSCSMPTDAQTLYVSATRATLSWTGSSFDPYEILWRQQGTTTFTSLTTTGYSYTLEGLSVNVGYEWKVRTLCGALGNTDFTNLQQFTTVCNTPNFVTIDNMSSYAAKLNWYGSDEDIRYTIRYRKQDSADWMTENDVGIIAGNYGRVEYLLPGLLTNTTYEVQIQGVCSPAVSSSFSTSNTFTTNCYNPYFGIVYSVGNNYITWSAISGVSYVVEWKRSSSDVWDNASPVVSTQEVNAYSGEYDTYTYSFTELLAGELYDVRVKAICADGSITYSYVNTIATTCPMYPPYSYSIPTVNSATLRWYYGGYVADNKIEVHWRPVGNTTWNVIQNVSADLIILNGLHSNTAYEWQVRNVCESGVSDFGPLQSFTTAACSVPTNLSVQCSTSSSAALNWTEVWQGSYDIQWRAVGQATWNTVSSLTSTAYSLTGLSVQTAYEWRIRTECGEGENASAYSEPQSFTTSATCSLPEGLSAFTYYTNGQTCGQILVSWTGCAGTNYDVQYKPQSTGIWISAGTTNYTTVLLNDLVANTAYDVQVRSVCSVGNSSSFVSTSFVSTACSCAPSAAVYTDDITSTAATSHWTSSNIATAAPAYEYRWRVGYTTTWNSLTTTNSSYRLANLAPDTPYEWQVRGLCNSGSVSNYSLISIFRTSCTSPGSLSSTNIGVASATLLWTGYTGVTYELRYRQSNGTWISVSNATSPYALTGLTTNASYEWQVRTNCSSGSSAFSASSFFKTQCAAPTDLVANFIKANSVELSWNSAGAAVSSYQLQYRVVGGSYTSLTVSKSASYTLTGLSSNTSYEWQVQTVCDASHSSGYPSQALTFQTLSASCGNMFTIQAGDWTNSAVWSCGRVPVWSDPVEVRHAITVPDGVSVRALQILFTGNGKLNYGTGSQVLLGEL
ncbi:fibronectin type III domain-containing protein [Spirosoma sp. SC4-14]|uniref:fibronectin type III domain-containing protein n=1 Tax=Spirosoma sp. SC4-14 TaxID=3128900 RepID=UPI0030D53761